MMPFVMILHNEPVNDGEPSEAGVLIEAADVGAALRSQGYEVAIRGVCRTTLYDTLTWLEARREEAVVFNLCEGLDGDARHEPLVAALLELHGIRFTGNTALTLGWALNKWVAKAIIRSAGIDTADARVFDAVPTCDQLSDIALPAIVKPVQEDGSLGISSESVVRTVSRLCECVQRVHEAHQQPALVERYLPGREFNAAVIGHGDGAHVLPLAEISFQGYGPDETRVVSHQAKWCDGSKDDLRTIPCCPAAVEARLGETLRRCALTTYRAFQSRDYARIDMRLDEVGQPFVIDVNPNPDISRGAGLARAAKEAGMAYEEFITTIMEAAWNRRQ